MSNVQALAAQLTYVHDCFKWLHFRGLQSDDVEVSFDL